MYCASCGNKLDELHKTEKIDAYHCDKCDKFWYKTVNESGMTLKRSK